MFSAKTTGDIQFTTAERAHTANTYETFPHYVTVNEVLFEIVLALRDNIFKHLKMIKSSFGAKALLLHNYSSESYIL